MDELRVSSKDLLTCFFTECESQFRFLELKHGYTYISGLVELKRGRQIITPYKNQEVTGFFWAVTRYEKDDHILEIIYGDKEFTLSGFSYFNQIHRLLWSDILRAAKKHSTAFENHMWMSHTQKIQNTIQDMAAAVKKHKRQLLTPNEKLLDKALTMRGKLMEQGIRDQYKKDLQDISRRAAKAFRDRDYQRVVELFTPYERDLSGSDLKKLLLSKRHMLEYST